MTEDRENIETDSLPPVTLGRHGGITIQREDTTVAFTSDRRLYLTADRGAVVEEGDPAAAYLLVGQGGEVSTAVARRYGLVAPGAQPAADPAPPAPKDPAAAEDLATIQDQAKAQPKADNKAVAPKDDK